MSRFNYTNEPIIPKNRAVDSTVPEPALLTDGTTLLRENICPRCNTGNRDEAAQCYQCGRRFRWRFPEVVHGTLTWTWWEMCVELPVYCFFFILRALVPR